MHRNGENERKPRLPWNLTGIPIYILNLKQLKRLIIVML